MKRTWKVTCVLFLVLALALAACSNNNNSGNSDSSGQTDATPNQEPGGQNDAGAEAPSGEAGFPIAAEPIELDMVRLQFPDVRPNAGETWMWQQYADMTNITVNWEEVPITNHQETIQLKLVSGDLPDAFYQMIFTTEQIIEQANAGNLIPLDELIAEHAPNIQAMFDRDPSIRQALTMPDGKIYSLPFVENDKNAASIRHYVNKSWLDQLGLSTPRTIDELSEVLKQFKEQDANGNGDPNDEYPIAIPAGNQYLYFQAFLGAYGLGNRGLPGANAFIDMGTDGKVRFFPTDERFRELLQQMNAWHAAGYFHPEYFTGVDVARWQQDGAASQVGLFGWVTPNYIGEEAQQQFTGVSQFVGPHGDAVMSWVDAAVRGIWSFMITSVNPHPVETIKWVDYWYGEEGYLLSSVGLEGETYQKGADSSYEWIGAVKQSIEEQGLQVGAFQHLERWYGGFEPHISNMELSPEGQQRINDLVLTKTPEETYLIDGNDINSYLPEEIWPGFVPNQAESEEIGAMITDITTYINEMIVQFITGRTDLDAGWDNYVSTLNRMGAERYLALKQQQYDRFQ